MLMINLRILYILTDNSSKEYYLKEIKVDEIDTISEYNYEDAKIEQTLSEISSILLFKANWYLDDIEDDIEKLYAEDFAVDKVIHVSKQAEETI